MLSGVSHVHHQGAQVTDKNLIKPEHPAGVTARGGHGAGRACAPNRSLCLHPCVTGQSQAVLPSRAGAEQVLAALIKPSPFSLFSPPPRPQHL